MTLVVKLERLEGYKMFKAGNIVRLKSGGPKMTVDKVNNSKISCVWFKDEHLKTAIFRKDTLELVDEGEKRKSSKNKSKIKIEENGRAMATFKAAKKADKKSV